MCLTLAFEKSIATLFNKTEEGCVTRTDEVWVMRCDCIDLCIEYKDRTNMSLPVASLDKRLQGYRIKRLSACGGCLGDYRR